jgi:hypothetical protein
MKLSNRQLNFPKRKSTQRLCIRSNKKKSMQKKNEQEKK